VTSAPAFAKINLALVVGPLRPDGKHEVATVLVRVDLHDTIAVEPTRTDGVVVDGFDDTIVHRALVELARRTGKGGGWRATIEKRIPVAAGLGGGSSDAATALLLANALGDRPLPTHELWALAMELGADVPFFLGDGPMLATSDGSELEPVSVPLDAWIVLVLPSDVVKDATAAVYEAFDARAGAEGFADRRASLLEALAQLREPSDLAALPGNDLASSPMSAELVGLGAFRADVTGAGPVVYGLFADPGTAERAARELAPRGRTWIVRPVASREGDR
jgi:4-diphosphocytidyl-2-C-methyl-D-erythritol kinase